MSDVKRSEQINELATALAKAQGKIKVAPKANVAKIDTRDGKGGYSYSYSTLADVWEACRAPLSENGLALIQTVAAEGSKVTVTTLLVHSSGQWISDDLTLAARDASPQAIGSCITYGRRYALGSMVGVVSEEDDDGAEATGRPTQVERKPNGPPAPSEHAPALFEEFRQALLAAKDQATLLSLGAKIKKAHETGKIPDPLRNQLLKTFNDRTAEVAKGAAA